jgi:hypothetical protein
MRYALPGREATAAAAFQPLGGPFMVMARPVSSMEAGREVPALPKNSELGRGWPGTARRDCGYCCWGSMLAAMGCCNAAGLPPDRATCCCCRAIMLCMNCICICMNCWTWGLLGSICAAMLGGIIPGIMLMGFMVPVMDMARGVCCCCCGGSMFVGRGRFVFDPPA